MKYMFIPRVVEHAGVDFVIVHANSPSCYAGYILVQGGKYLVLDTGHQRVAAAKNPVEAAAALERYYEEHPDQDGYIERPIYYPSNYSPEEFARAIKERRRERQEWLEEAKAAKAARRQGGGLASSGKVGPTDRRSVPKAAPVQD
jgi:hypothetical protein